MVRTRWSAVLGLCLLTPAVWSAAPTAAHAAPAIGRVLRSDATTADASQARVHTGTTSGFDQAVVAHPSNGPTTDARIESLGARTLRTTSSVSPEVLTSGASLVARPGTDAFTVNPTNVDWTYRTGHSGRVKVGIIDFFDAATLSKEVAALELRPIDAAHKKCLRNGAGCTFGATGSKHGNAIAEAIADQAPGAELFLAQASTLRDYRVVVDWFAANGVKIVNHSLIGNFDGPGNGTGPQDDIVNYAVSKGMAWFNAAGDMGIDPTYTSYAGSYWRGTWTDPDNDGWLNFKGTDETLGTYCGALLGLRWSDWGAGRTDYELWANDVVIATRTNKAAVLVSNRNQAASVNAAAPLEGNDFRWLCNTNPALGPVYDTNKDGFIALKVKRSTRSTAASSKGDKLELQVNNGFFEYAVDAGSVGAGFADTKNPGAASITYDGPGTSRGPTNDGRIKPDLTARGCSPTMAYGSCQGAPVGYWATDTATAVVSGTAAVVLDAIPMSPAQLVRYLLNSANGDHRTSVSTYTQVVPNNRTGWGMVRLHGSNPNPQPLATAPYVPGYQRLVDTRIANPVRTGTAPIPRNGTLVLSVKTTVDPSPRARTVVLNITTTNTLSAGTVQVGPAPRLVPGASTSIVVGGANQSASALVVTPVDADGSITLYTTAGGHFIVDYLGMFDPGALPGSGSGLVPMDPVRIYNSRCAGCTALPAGGSRDITVAGSGSATDGWKNVPTSDLTSLVVSITADSAAGSGFVSAVPTSDLAPANAQTVNVVAGRSATGTTIVRVDSLGKIRLYASVATHVQVDVIGYFTRQGGGWFTAIDPTHPIRALDTRAGGAPVPAANSVSDVPLAAAGVPAEAGAVIGTVALSSTAGLGAAKVGRSDAALADTFRNLTSSSVGQSSSAGLVTAVQAGHARMVTTMAAHRQVWISGWFSDVNRADPASLHEVPPAPAAVTSVVLTSANGQHMLAVSAPPAPATAQWMMFHVATETWELLDMTGGGVVPNGYIDVRRISNDGRRLVFQSNATNLGGISSGNLVATYLLDLDAGAPPTQVDLTVDGTTRTPYMFVDDDVTKKVTSDFASVGGAPAQWHTWLTPLSGGTPTLLTELDGTVPISFSGDLTSAVLQIGVWRAGAPAIAMSFGPSPFVSSMSPDGHYAIIEGATVDGNVTFMVDLFTMQRTTLCGATQRFSSGRIEWSAGPPSPSTWCTNNPYRFTVSAKGVTSMLSTWNGQLPKAGQEAFVAGGSVLVILHVQTPGTGFDPSTPVGVHVYVWDNPLL